MGSLPALPREINLSQAAVRGVALLAPPVRFQRVEPERSTSAVEILGMQDTAGLARQLHLFITQQTVEPHTLAEAAERYRLEHLLVDGHSQSTIDWREAALRLLVKRFGGRPIDGRFRDVAAEVYADARRRARERGRDGGGEAGASLVVNTLARVLNLAGEWGWRFEKHDLKGMCAVRSKKRVVHMRRDELARIGEQLVELVDSGRRVAVAAACVQLIFLTSMRVSEAATLQWRDLDLDDGVIHLRDSKTGPRDVVLGPAAVLHLRSLRIGRTCIHVFPRRRGDGPINRRQVLDALQLACKRARAPKTVVHALRHHFATVGAQLDLPTKTMSLALGHSVQWQTTEYQHPDLEDVRRVVARVETAVVEQLAGKAVR